MLNKDALYNELLEGLILSTYGRVTDLPMSADFDERAIARYRSDPMFNCEVKGMATGIMSLIDKHES